MYLTLLDLIYSRAFGHYGIKLLTIITDKSIDHSLIGIQIFQGKLILDLLWFHVCGYTD